MKFSKHFKLKREQPELDFVDVDPSQDLRLFIDPYALAYRLDTWSVQCAEDVLSFFQAAVDAIRSGEDSYARALLNNLQHSS